jgi:hypothetical protein
MVMEWNVLLPRRTRATTTTIKYQLSKTTTVTPLFWWTRLHSHLQALMELLVTQFDPQRSIWQAVWDSPLALCSQLYAWWDKSAFVYQISDLMKAGITGAAT